MWEDGYCRGRGGTEGCYGDMEGEDPVRKSFSKMSIQLYNYGEGWVLGRSLITFYYHICLHEYMQLLTLFNIHCKLAQNRNYLSSSF